MWFLKITFSENVEGAKLNEGKPLQEDTVVIPRDGKGI